MTKLEDTVEANIKLLLLDKKFEDVLKLLKQIENEVITNNVWNLINLICVTVKTNNLLKNESDVLSCQNILLHLASKGSSKEVIIALLEEADSFKDHEFFCLLLKPLQQSLIRSSLKLDKFLDLILSSLNAHIEAMPLPQNLDLQGEEKILSDADSAVIDTNYVLTNYLEFLKPFVEKATKASFLTVLPDLSHERETLVHYILKLLHRPFLYHDLHVESVKRPKSTIRVLCENYVECLTRVHCNVLNIFKLDKCLNNNLTGNTDDIIPELAFSNLAYLIFVENFALCNRPFVHSHLFVFMSNLKYIISLLLKKENLVLFKGLYLGQALLDQLLEFELHYDCMELEVFTSFPKVVLNVAINCPYEEHRNFAVKLFLNYVNKLDWKGRYHLIMQIISSMDHSGANGLVINLYKNYLNECLKCNASSDYFLGSNFLSFCNKIFILKDGVETDLLENSDKILSALNFLRYLLLRDKKEENCTGIWDIINEIHEKYVKTLTMALDLSKAHYKQALQDAINNKKCKKAGFKMNVNVGNGTLPNVPDFQKEVLNKALVTLDMIESILFRVKDLIPT